MPSKDDTAQLLADAHFGLDPAITRIFRVLAPGETSGDVLPVKLLEISSLTPEAGISPVGMTADPSRGVYHASVVIEVSPAEFEGLLRGELTLPQRWQVADELFPHQPATRAAS